ncbi:LOW QUALITY PROTEIN: uncharacterized protein LOC121379688 [Gigantopelta aegis]|uniref:LOW QUALITY PROTEIN: uncharacterized protein LOC121379688 n=1 Tax=Gigantopelta aegis TaxID=1735272 RepID=UPI001B888F45|nr:LOW QUALITY PROTEIN: uncharacterized protein LOC121379688 [Gigantopelta aegis]
MADATAVVEGRIKFRDGKKWKRRWCAMRKPSPVADRLQVLLYKDVKEAMREGGKPKRTCLLEGFYGLESDFDFDHQEYVMAIICQKQVVLMAFESNEDMIQFHVQIRRSLGEEHQFPVQIAKVPSNSKLPLQSVKLLIHGQRFCFTVHTCHTPPRILQTWQISDLRRFGSVDGKFCFEGGSKCGKGVGFHVLLSDHADDIAKIVHLASVGKSPSCQRAANKRSSQFPGTLDSLCSSPHHGTPQSMLGGYSLGRNQDLWTWNKRHSISVIDYRRMAGLTDKLKMISIENLERQRLMAIYDIPPNRVRKVDNSSSPPQSANSMQKMERDQKCPMCCAQRIEKQNLCIHGYMTSLFHPEHCGVVSSSSYSDSNSSDSREQGIHSGNYSNYFMVGQQSNFQLSVIEDEFRSAVDRCRRQEALQSLKNEESSLQREITLLDEILQVCKGDDHAKPESQNGVQKTTNKSVKASSLPTKVRKDYAVDAEFCKHVGVSVSAENCSRSNNQNSNQNTASPNVLSKLEKIPFHSKLLVPLPYINLSKFDENGDGSSSHVHMPGSKENMLSGSKEKLTNGSREKRTVGSGCNSSSLTNVSSSGSGEKIVRSSPSKTKEKLGMRSSSESHIAIRSTALIREPIYANEVRRKSDTPPPELPPKGPALLRKSINRGLVSMMSGMDSSLGLPPPLPPTRDRSKSVGSTGKIHGYDNAPGRDILPNASMGYTASQDCYLMMGEFMDEPKPSSQSSSSQHGHTVASRRNTSFEEASYFDMVTDPGYNRECFRHSRSYSASGVIENQFQVSTHGRNSPAPALPPKKNELQVQYRQTRPESNYMEMTGLTSKRSSVLQNLQTLQNYVSTTPASNNSDSSGQTPKPAIPFPQLITYQKPKVENTTSPILTSQISLANQEQPKESSGFLARFKRRNSRDQKAASQSQENLIGVSQHSIILERSQSEQGEQPKVEKVQCSPLLKIGRRRSSSFPNRLSYQESIAESKTSSESSREDVQLYISEKQLQDDDRSNGFPYRQTSADSARLSEDSERSTNDSFCGDDYKDSDIQPLLKSDDNRKEIKVLTVLHVCQDFVYNPTASTTKLSKTDDEKLIELLQNGYSSKLGKMSDVVHKSKASIYLQKVPSPAEQAAEIARHVTLLPPFIPPKAKNYCMLSPVRESSPTFSPLLNSVDTESIYVEMKEPKPEGSVNDSDVPVSPSAQKLKAQASLRIRPAVEDDNGKVWVPRTCSPVPAPEASGDDVDAADDDVDDVVTSVPLQCSTLVVSVDDLIELYDSEDHISISSRDSDTHSIRSSPASTILRPHSGLNYQMIDRRPAVSESEPSSPRTPYSPSTATVFSFDSEASFSSSNTSSTKTNTQVLLPSAQQIREMELSRVKLYSRETSPEANFMSVHHGYLNIGVSHVQQARDSDSETRSLSLSRETSPKVPSHVPTSLSLPAEQVNRQLNYLEIDLSPPANPPKKHKKPVPKKVTAIEYAQIDMVATKGLSKASLEHAQSRKDTDSLRRSASCATPSTTKNSFSLASSQKERKSSARERQLSTGSLDES